MFFFLVCFLFFSFCFVAIFETAFLETLVDLLFTMHVAQAGLGTGGCGYCSWPLIHLPSTYL